MSQFPGVIVKEIDLTTRVVTPTTVNGAYVGETGWGPVQQPILYANETEFLNLNGRPNANNYQHWFSAAGFLRYGPLYFVRVVDEATAVNASSLLPTLIKNVEDYGQKSSTILSNAGSFIAKYPGKLGNSIRIALSDENRTQLIFSAVYVSGDDYDDSGPEEVTQIIDGVTISAYVDEWTAASIGQAGSVLKVRNPTGEFQALTDSDYIPFANTPTITFANNTAFSLGNMVKPATANGWVYEVTSAGTSAVSGTPAWPTTIGSTVTSGTVTFTAVGKHSYSLGDIIRPATANGWAYEVTAAGSSATSGTPSWPTTLNGTVTSGTATFKAVTRYSIVGTDSGVSYRGVSSVTDLFSEWEYADRFNGAPGTSTYAAGKSAVNDELHIVIIDQKGLFSGTPGEVLEVFQNVSKASDAKFDGGGNSYYKTVINETSQYVWWGKHPDPLATNWGDTAEDTGDSAAPANSYYIIGGDLTIDLQGGEDGYGASTGEIIQGYDLYASKETTQYRFLLSGANCGNQSVVNNILDIVESRKDSMAFLSPRLEDLQLSTGTLKANAVVSWRKKFRSTSYGTMDSTWFNVYDKYNDVERKIPANPFTAGLVARMAQSAEIFFSPMGYERGIYSGVNSAVYVPNDTQKAQLFSNGINIVATESGQGIVLMGDKTMLSKNSAFDALNVRFLFIVIEEAIAFTAKFTIGQFNNERTRNRFTSIVDQYLTDIQGRQGLVDKRVVCDSTNNTPQVIAERRFVANILIKPSYAVRTVELNFFASGPNIEFEEV